ncbi:aa3-type cytochrome c oxidase subunit IV [Novosphingobium sp. FKTRR1]|nr:aa3-type cytochrome c oxidase subunit IV [Novosphingobium sp. FKTRR1]
MGSVNNIKAARETYEGFIGLIKVSVPVIIAIVAFVIYIIQ